MPDTSTPSPSDPDSENKGLPPIPDPENQPAENTRPRLKLNRLVVKDIEINPHINPDAEPVPRAEPISEPDPEPLPEKVVPENKPLAAIEPVPPAPKEPETETAENQPVDKPNEEPPAAEIKAPPAKSKRRGRKLIFPVILIIGSLLYGIHIIFDPMGWKSSEVDSTDIQRQTTTEPSAEEISRPEEPQWEISNLLSDATKPNVQDYLEQIGQQELKLSNSPRGIFINSVFYAEGMPLNPSLGLTVQSIPADAESNLIVVDADGNAYELAIP